MEASKTDVDWLLRLLRAAGEVCGQIDKADAFGPPRSASRHHGQGGSDVRLPLATPA